MYRSCLFLTSALVGTNVALVQPVVMSLSTTEIFNITKAVTVEIKLQQDESVGSGILIHRQGDLYTLVTNRHVVCGSKSRKKVPAGESYDLRLADGRHYRVSAANVQLLGADLDLAAIQFRSNQNYVVAKIAPNDSVNVPDNLYTAGFPLEKSEFLLGIGKASAIVNKRLAEDRGGYTMIYNAYTLPGMSGGGVFNSDGLLVAIHGQGDRYRENTELNSTYVPNDGNKLGYNRGIPIRWVVQTLAAIKINLGQNLSRSKSKTARQQVLASADEHFIAGFNKFVEPGAEVVAGKRQAILEFSKAIELNPKYFSAYFLRANSYEQLQEFQLSLSDYNRAIALDPQYADAYNNRANLKKNKLNDIRGALVDYDRSIVLSPKFAAGYNNRGILKQDDLNDLPGALADYDRAIALDPKFSDAYVNRGILKYEKLNDVRGALADYDRAIVLNPKNSFAYNNRANPKKDKLNDISGALADYDRAIALNPKYTDAYYNRGMLKLYNLNDVPGALADYDRAIAIDPKYALVYKSRAILKNNKLNDVPGAIQDLRQAARIFRSQGQAQLLQDALEALKQLGAAE